MIRRMVMIFAFPFLLFSTSCATAPNPPAIAASPEMVSAIAIKIELPVQVAFNSLQGFKADQIFFVNLDRNESLIQREIISSNYYCDTGVAERYLFLMNAAPGKYAAVAAVGTAQGNSFGGGGKTNFMVLFPETMIEASIIDARAGELVLMGPFYLNTVASMNYADKSQLFYHELFSGGDRIKGYWENMVSVNRYVAPTYDLKAKDDKVEPLVLEILAGCFENTQWNRMIEKRMSYLNCCGSKK